MSGKNGFKVVLFSVLVSAMFALESPVFAYVVSTTGTGTEIKWQDPSASYFLNTSGGPSGSLDSIQAAMHAWSDVPTSSFVFVYAGTTTSSSHGNNDGQNIVTFAPMGSDGTLAENVFWYSGVTGRILDSDLRFNTSYSWSASGTPGVYDVQNIATHELGHSLSLDDLYGVADSEKTMYGYASPGETKKRTLDPDDIAGIAHLYPGGGTTGDFDGDRKADIAVWRSAPGIWYVYRSGDNTMASRQWGQESLGDIPVSGDYDGDGKTDIAVWRSGSGTWYIYRSTDNTVISRQWGLGSLNDVPVPGDYDGDGKMDVAVWRRDSGIWYILRSTDGGMTTRQWGMGSLSDVPVPGDYDGDGKTDIAVWRSDSGTWYICRSIDSTMVSLPWGLGSLSDIPVPGDYDGDGKTDIAVWRSDSGTWHVYRSSDNTVVSLPWGLGSPNDVPVPGDYDGDGRTDVAVWRRDGGVWYILRSSDGGMISRQWGMSGDQPMNRPVHRWGSP